MHGVLVSVGLIVLLFRSHANSHSFKSPLDLSPGNQRATQTPLPLALKLGSLVSKELTFTLLLLFERGGIRKAEIVAEPRSMFDACHLST